MEETKALQFQLTPGLAETLDIILFHSRGVTRIVSPEHDSLTLDL
jgi:hypothetical protein